MPSVRAAVFLALAATAMAYHITTPDERDGWSCNTQNKVEWQMVSSDIKTFSMILTNQDRDVMSRPHMLSKVVNGKDRTATIDPPLGGWNAGENYRVNFEHQRGGILAQSMPFTIECPEPEPESEPEATTPKSTTPKTPTTSESQSEPKSEPKTEPKTGSETSDDEDF